MTQHNTPVAIAPVQTAYASVTSVPLLFTTLSPIKCFHTLLGVNEHCIQHCYADWRFCGFVVFLS